MGRKPLDVTGLVAGTLLTGIRPVGRSGRHITWEFRCECGKVVVLSATVVATGRTKSCGCLAARQMPEALARRALIQQRRDAGETLAEIARSLGISKQRVFQILKGGEQ